MRFAWRHRRALRNFGVAGLAAISIGALPACTVPATPPPAGATPLIVDSDMFSSTDDVGALGLAFALQRRGEASVIAIGIDTPRRRASVSTNSWRCAAAIAQFYGAASVPIGSALPDNGTARNTVDWTGPCAALASGSTPSPQSAVSVFRRRLATQADGTVVVVATGYLGNLSALLSSPADASSPLTGRELVAKKVRRLVIMGGGYPSRSYENNLGGDPAAAQNVAANWPTKVVWSGYEVGDLVHNGDSLSRVHPANSPVRVAYESFVGPNNWMYSYDLTAVYHAVRPGDALLTEVGPGTNRVDDSGGNAFAPGAGKQYYLRLSNPALLSATMEGLLDQLP